MLDIFLKKIYLPFSFFHLSTTKLQLLRSATKTYLTFLIIQNLIIDCLNTCKLKQFSKPLLL